MKKFYTLKLQIAILFCLLTLGAGLNTGVKAQSFSQSNLNFNGKGSVWSGTSLMFGPDGRLYMTEYSGEIKIFTIEQNGPGDYVVMKAEVLTGILQIQDYNDDGTLYSSTKRETLGITVAGTPANPVIYVTSSDFRVGAGGGGDLGLDTNSGIITRLTWNGSSWDEVDIVRGLPRSEENHATNGLEFVTVNGIDYLIVAQGGHTNAGGPSKNFAYTTEYALAAAILSVNLTQIETMPILDDNGRKYVYDIPTLDDPSRANVNGITDPDAPGYDGIDVNDPFGGNDGLNQAMIVPGGPVQIFSPGYRNAYDLVVTEAGAVYVTDNGANGGWGGFPVNEGGGTANNNYDPNEPGSSTTTSDGEKTNNKDHLSLVTLDIQNYSVGSFYGGHPTPVRANPFGAGLYTNPAETGTSGAVFRTLIYHPTKNTDGFTTDPNLGLPANWPPVKTANPQEGDFRGPGDSNPDGPVDELVTIWGTNTNGIDEYSASNYGGAMKGNLIAGVNTGELRRVELNPDGSLLNLVPSFASGLGGNALGITCNGDFDPFPGTIWVLTLDGTLMVLEPDDFICPLPGELDYDPTADYDQDGYSNQDEEDNGTDPCNGGSQPNDFDKIAGGTLISDLNDTDDDNDGIPDAEDPFQLGDVLISGSDAFVLPVINELFSSNNELKGYLGLGLTGLMNNGAANPNWLEWLDRRDDPNDPNPNDILGGAIGAMTMQMTSGTALGSINTQEKGFQYGVQVDQTTGVFTVAGNLVNFNDPLQLYGNSSAPNGELGIFIGDGTQSNYIKFVLTPSGIKVQQEINDTPLAEQNLNISAAERPTSGATLYFRIDPSSGEITLEYRFDNQSIFSAGTVTAQGAVLNAIQQTGSDLAVGFIGTSNAAGVEVEGTWDFLNVTANAPVVVQDLPDLIKTIGAADENIDLDQYFYDDKGLDNITYSVTGNTNTVIGATISNNILTLNYPTAPAVSDITIRATDSDLNFIEQTFNVTVQDVSAVLYRVNSGGSAITSIDAEMDWGGDTSTAVSPYVSEPGNNKTYAGSIVGYTNEVDQTTTPVSIFDTERYDGEAGAPNLTYSFPVQEVGFYEVRLYMGNGWSGTAEPGQRIFDVDIEGVIYSDLDDLDLSATFGNGIGAVITQIVEITDGSLDISFIHGVENPLINGIEILGSSGLQTPIQVTAVPDQINTVGENLDGNLVVSATGGDGNLSYSMTGAPLGVNIEPTNGQIGGSIGLNADTGSPYTVTITVDDNDDKTTDAVTTNFNWKITTGEPVILEDFPDLQRIIGAADENFDLNQYFYDDKGSENLNYTVETNTNTSVGAAINLNILTLSYPSAPAVSDITIRATDSDLNFIEQIFKVTVQDVSVWVDKDENENYTARHECSFVQAGDKFYLMGGRESAQTIDIYDYTTNSWSSLISSAPLEFNHFQATEYQGLIWVIGAFKTNISPELPAEHIWIFNPATKEWMQGPQIPTNRQRGSAGLSLYNDKFYISGGNTLGHNGGYVSWFDEYDPETGIWTPLADAPRARDHFQSAVIGGKLYLAGGRLSGGTGGTWKPVIPEVDVYDFTSASWSTLPAGQNIPTPRAAASVVNFKEKLVVIGGEVENEPVYGVSTTDALKITEEYDPITGTWKRLADLNYERHGTQAIVSGDGISILAGSPNKGGGNQKNMEYMGIDAPVGDPSVASILSAPDLVQLTEGVSTDVALKTETGNVGIIVTSMEISGPQMDNFVITSGELTQGLLKPNAVHLVSIDWNGTAAGESAVLSINYGATEQINIALESITDGSIIVEQIANQISYAGEVLTGGLAVTATGGDGALVYSISGAPLGVTVDSASGVISGTIDPDADVSSPYSVVVMVDDSDAQTEDAVSTGFTWTVTEAPQTQIEVAAVADQTNIVGDVLDETLVISATGGDGDLVYSMTGAPLGVIINSTTGVISGTIDPDADVASPYSVVVSVDDSDSETTDAVSTNFTWTVTEIPQTPIEVAVVADQINVVGDVLDKSLVISATGGDGELIFSMTGAPLGVIINSTTGVISGTIDLEADISSPYSVVVMVDDSDDKSEDAVITGFTWTVTKGEPVVVEAMPDLERYVNTADENIDLNTYFDDNQGVENLTYTVESSNSSIGASIAGSILKISYPSVPAISNVKIIATDVHNNLVEQSFTITVSDIPLVLHRVNTGGPAIAAIDGEKDWGADTSTANSTYLTEPGSNTVAGYSMTSYDPGVDLSTTPTDIFTSERSDGTSGPPNMTYSFPVPKAGTYQVRLYFGSGHTGNSREGRQIFDVKIEGVIYPELDDLDLIVAFGHQVGGVISQSIEVVDGFIDISFVHGAKKNPMINGIEIINASETDSPIQVAQIQEQNDVAGDQLDGSLIVSATGGDGDLVYSMAGAPSGVIINSVNGTISGIIDVEADISSPYSVVVSVDDSDGGTTDAVSTNFTWTVTGATTPIAVTGIPDQINVAGDQLDGSLVASASGGDGDLVYSMTGAPMGVSINSVTGVISGTIDAGADASSPYNVIVSVDDSDEQSDDFVSTGFTWTVRNISDTSIVVADINNQTNVAGDELNGSLAVSASGGDGDLVYSITGAPLGVVINSTTGVITGTIDSQASTESPYSVTVNVDDSDDQTEDSVSKSFTWTISSGAPVIAENIPDMERFTSTADEDIYLDTYFNDNDGVENLIYFIDGNTDPAIGAVISGNILTVSYPSTPAVSDITVTAQDADLLTVNQTFRVTVVEETAGSLVLYRVNAGGPGIAAIDEEMDWGTDTSTENSPYLTEPGSNTTSGYAMTGYDSEVDLTTTPTAIFSNERSDGSSGPPNMTYSFPVAQTGFYEIRLYFGNGHPGSSRPGRQIFDVSIEGVIHPELNDVDLTAKFGHQIGGVISKKLEVTDGFIDISFLHGAKKSPLINGIEIIRVSETEISLTSTTTKGGSPEATKIVVAEEDIIEPVEYDVQIYPNPVVSEAFIKVSDASIEIEQMYLYGYSGQLIRTIDAKRAKVGEGLYMINVFGLPDGVYLVKLDAHEYSNLNLRMVVRK